MNTKDPGIKALKSIHDLMIRGRIMAWENDNPLLFQFMDDLEYLVALLMEDNDTTEEFKFHLKAICQKIESTYIFENYLKR